MVSTPAFHNAHIQYTLLVQALLWRMKREEGMYIIIVIGPSIPEADMYVYYD